ncbi:uncharacterized protein LOC111704771 [Eurytemora carolleeae]|uniref:uncharacterized protein LOC111704771 n=1 Tax=Eurytemora carolleeae TaxID=1294199 RepID=UPI000C75A4E4|nr:uncharacterized protein LOC111704771 [Eurytemora carolleeae]|eukprot:XP_023332875.1 uncharacterized protein LOC111704771 [Eurytemora affinis]
MSTCCCCFPLDVGVWTIANLELIGHVVILGTTFWTFGQQAVITGENLGLLILQLVIWISGALCVLLLIAGLQTKTARYMVPSLIWGIIGILLNAASMIWQIVNVVDSVDSGLIIGSIVAVYLIGFLISLYFLFVKYRRYVELKEENEIRPMA